MHWLYENITSYKEIRTFIIFGMLGGKKAQLYDQAVMEVKLNHYM